MTRRHAQHRRRSYGRRQHEVHERERVLDGPLTEDAEEETRAGSEAGGREPRAMEPQALRVYEHPAARAIFARVRGDAPEDGSARALLFGRSTRSTAR